MSTSPFLDAILPLPAPPEDRYIWAKVTQASPLRIQVDGDRVPLGITPDTLVGGLLVDQRVYCQIINRRLVVLGASGGVALGAWSAAGITYASGYAGTGVSNAEVGYLREGPWVNLMGLVSKTGGWATTGSILVLTLPEGARPRHRVFVAAPTTESSAGSNGTWVIEPTGNVYHRPHASAPTIGYYSLDGIRYLAA